MTFEFAILADGLVHDDLEQVLDKLYEAGCDDATPVLRSGVLTIWFDREADTLQAAIEYAKQQVEKAGIKPIFVQWDDIS